MKNLILLKRKYLVSNDNKTETRNESLYFAAKLLNEFGVLVDKPERVTRENVELISNFYGVNIPTSFYANPQDTKYFTTEELFIEQVISYWKIGFIGTGNEDYKTFKRVELFSKILPDYQEGKEVVFRNYQFTEYPAKEIEILTEIANDLASYSRKWSETESEEFEWLYSKGYLGIGKTLRSKDNLVEMFNKHPNTFFSSQFNRSDVVKLSIEMVGEEKTFCYSREQARQLILLVGNCKKTPVTKKQAKYFNTIIKKLGLRIPKVNNDESPEKIATELIAKGYIVEAAEVFANSGAMLSRHLVWLLSRATADDAVEILNMIKVTNPLVAMQLLESLLETGNEPRSFSFFKNRKVTRHNESDYETKYRKSNLSIGMKKTIKETLLNKVDEFYINLGGLGNVYIDEKFKQVAVPFNTSADGDGLDTLPAGSRVKIKGDYIRTFTYWKNLHDVDSSLVLVNKDGKVKKLYWGNCSSKIFGNSVLSSGDDTSNNGAEYLDIKLSELEALDWEYAIFQLNGYGDEFNKGETYCGYQDKNDLETQAWDAKNMALKVKLPKADSSNYMGFAIDIKKREIIIINKMQDSSDRIVNGDVMGYLKKYMNDDYLKQFNIYKIASLRGEIVDKIENADVIFSDTLVAVREGQKVIKTSDTEKLVSLML